jgi:hypothetical protein
VATRTIITSQPDVACDVCERRLLRGEQPDIFIAAGRRRIVCELCAPRAAHEGWLRESQAQALTMPPLRPRRGRSLIDKLRQVGRPAPGQAGGPELPDSPAVAGAAGAPATEIGSVPQPYDFLDGYPPGSVDAELAPAAVEGEQPLALPYDDGGVEASAGFAFSDFDAPADAAEPGSDIERALEIFNSSEYPRRVAGVARSLGPPAVNVRHSDYVDGAVSIVVAWELCWYRYEVDLAVGAPEARVIAQGTELSELAAVEQLANAAADEFGALGAPVA